MVQLIFDKGVNKLQWENRIDTCRIKKMGMLFALAKINSQWIKDLNVRPEAIKLLEDNTEKPP